MKTLTMIFATSLVTIALVVYGEEPTQSPSVDASVSHVEKVQQAAAEMEVFPIDFIANNGPLSHCMSNQFTGSEPRLLFILFRRDLTWGETVRFFKFCQLALDASSNDVDVLTERLPQAPPKEQALILTILYIYVYPWKNFESFATGLKEFEDEITRNGQITPDEQYWLDRLRSSDDELVSWNLRREIGVRSWLFLECSRGVFRLDSRADIGLTKQREEKIYRIIESYLSNKAVAFPAREQKMLLGNRYEDRLRETKQARERFLTLQEKYGRITSLEEFKTDSHTGLIIRKKGYDEIYAKYPSETASEAIAFLTYPPTEETILAPGNAPYANASDMTKTVGLVARQLLCSWAEASTAN